MKNSTKLAVAVAVAALVAGFAASDALAGYEINVAPGKTLAGPGIAVHGYDPVAYFTEQRPVQGSAEHQLVHENATYRFSSAENKKAFEANPGKYVPAYGGFCAYGVSVGAKFDGDPRYWKIVDGKLYLNLNKKIQDTWKKDIPGNIGKAEKSWKKIKDKNPATLG